MSKRKKKEKEPKADSFTALFLALTIILLAFFILLNSIAELDTQRCKRALRSFQAARAGMGIFGMGIGLDETSKSPGGPDSKLTILDNVHDLIQQSLTKWGEGKTWIDAYEDERRLVISLQDVAVFDAGSQTLHPRIFGFLDGVGQIAKRIQVPITIQGHSDATPSGGKASNWELSAARAGEVARYMTEGVHLPESLVEAEAFSSNRPIADNSTAEGQNRNRRVDMVFYKRDLNRLKGQ